MRDLRYLGTLIEELAKGKPMAEILQSAWPASRKKRARSRAGAARGGERRESRNLDPGLDSGSRRPALNRLFRNAGRGIRPQIFV